MITDCQLGLVTFFSQLKRYAKEHTPYDTMSLLAIQHLMEMCIDERVEIERHREDASFASEDYSYHCKLALKYFMEKDYFDVVDKLYEHIALAENGFNKGVFALNLIGDIRNTLETNYRQL